MRIKVVNPVIVTSVDWGPLMKTGYAHAHDDETELEYVSWIKASNPPSNIFGKTFR